MRRNMLSTRVHEVIDKMDALIDRRNEKNKDKVVQPGQTAGSGHVGVGQNNIRVAILLHAAQLAYVGLGLEL